MYMLCIGEIAKRVGDEIAKGATIYTFSTCPFCMKSKGILNDYKGIYNEVQLDKHVDGELIRAELKKRTGRTSVPSIWIDGQFVGGFSDGGLGGIKLLRENGSLEDLLYRAGAMKGLK
jgi:glutaredoxin 3